jgi:hypothetical protein
MKKLIMLMGVTVFLFTSCKKNLPDVGGTSAEKVANEWWVTLTINNVDVYGIGHYKLVTSNTADNDSKIWIDDQKNGYGFKLKADVDYSNLSFTSTAADNNTYFNPANPPAFPKSVKVTEGKVLLGVGRSKSGNATDSIYMKVEFSDDPGTIYEVKGHARTKFIEDEY